MDPCHTGQSKHDTFSILCQCLSPICPDLFDRPHLTLRLVGCIGFNTTLTAKVISWHGDAHCVSWLFDTSILLTQLFFPKPPTTFLICFCRGEKRKYAVRKVASTRNQTHNHQVISLTRSQLSHPGGAFKFNP